MKILQDRSDGQQRIAVPGKSSDRPGIDSEIRQSREDKAEKVDSPLPCLLSNNSIEDWNKLQSNHRKTATALAENIADLVQRYGIERIGFLTITTADQVEDFQELQRRWNSFRTNALGDRYAEWVMVKERMKSNACHLHLVVVLDTDIRTGFRFEDIASDDWRDHDYSSASPALRNEWKFLRDNLPKYNLGRSELLPIKDHNAIGKYVGKYISKHVGQRNRADWGKRMVVYSQGFKKCHTGQYMHHNENSTAWRNGVKRVAAELGIQHFCDFTDHFGPRWAFWNQDRIIELGGMTDEQYQEEVRRVRTYGVPAVHTPRPAKEILENLRERARLHRLSQDNERERGARLSGSDGWWHRYNSQPGGQRIGKV